MSEKAEKGYVEAFLTLNYDYTSDKVKDMKIAEYLKYFKKMFQKSGKKSLKNDCLGLHLVRKSSYVLVKKKISVALSRLDFPLNKNLLKL